MNNLKPAAAQMQHVGEMTEAREDVAGRRARNPFQSTIRRPQLARRQPGGCHQSVDGAARPGSRPRPPRVDARQGHPREYFGGCSRAHYWKVTKKPDFPKARQISPRIRVRNRFEIEEWLAEQPEVA